jgi:hypothetical protein
LRIEPVSDECACKRAHRASRDNADQRAECFAAPNHRVARGISELLTVSRFPSEFSLLNARRRLEAYLARCDNPPALQASYHRINDDGSPRGASHS